MWDMPSQPAAAAALLVLLAGCSPVAAGQAILYRDDFRHGLANWAVEVERPGRISARGGVLDIDVPAGATLWFRPELRSPVAIDYELTAVAAGGPNDQVSDANVFWMATDARLPTGDVLKLRRSGAFADYDSLRTYYAGIGGNRNTTTRFRRYVGRRGERPLLPGHDLAAAEYLLKPNRWYRMRLVADGSRIELRRDGVALFRFVDPDPYTRGRFGIRTTWSHLRVRNLTIRTLAGTAS